VHRLQAVYRPDGVVEHYRYDAGNNLVEAPGLGEHLPASGPQHAPGTPLQPVVLDTGNRLWRANGERFHHDERDHVVARESHEGVTYYLRDAADQLRKVVRSEDTIFEAWYDVLGRRSKVRTAAGERTFYWDTDRLAAELGPHGALRVYVYAGRDGIVPIGFVDYASADAEPASGHSYSVHADHQGSVERVYNARGKLVWRCAYAPYGAARVEVGAGFYQPLRMPGHYWDADTQLHYNRFRYYDPALARYLESDPLGIAGGANLYAYTWNPLSEVDVRGLAKSCPNAVEAQVRARVEREGRPDKEELNERGLTRAQERDYRARIDHAEQHGDPSAQRYERYVLGHVQRGTKPEDILPQDKWKVHSDRALRNGSRGREMEGQSRVALANHTGKPLANNNAGATLTQHGTRPDSVGQGVVHEHKHFTGEGEQTVYNTEQMRAQQKVAGNDQRHVVTLSSDKPNLDGKPPDPRPSRELHKDENRDIYYVEPAKHDEAGNELEPAKVTRVWNPKKNRWDPA
jgi:RHS repeat-associated protein